MAEQIQKMEFQLSMKLMPAQFYNFKFSFQRKNEKVREMIYFT